MKTTKSTDKLDIIRYVLITTGFLGIVIAIIIQQIN